MIPQEQGSQEWLEYRKNKICASDIPIILGESPWSTPLLLWRRKLGFEGEQKDNAAMARGREKEPEALAWVNETFAMCFAPTVVGSKNLHFAMASLDGYDQKQNIIAEIKWCNGDDHKEAKQNKIPKKYVGQVQWQLFCSDAKECWYISCHGDEKVIVKIQRDDAYLAEILTKVAEFYRCIIEMEEPPYSERDSVQIEDGDFQEMAETWKQANRLKKQYTDQEKRCKEELCKFSDDGNIHGYGVKLVRVNRDGAMDWNAFYQDVISAFPEIEGKFPLDKYKKEQIGYWKISEYED